MNDVLVAVYSENRFEALYFVPLLYGRGYLYNVSFDAYKHIMAQDGTQFAKPVDSLTLRYGRRTFMQASTNCLHVAS
jgi:hypothetical protein